MKSSKQLNKALRKKLTPGPERGGVITPDFKVIEFANIADDDHAYRPALNPSDVGLLNQAVATWHTHPAATANLSPGDFQTFLQWPHLLHAIVGEEGTAWYRVEQGKVLHA